MKFTDEYFEDEVRDGYYVSSMMKKAWAAQMEVLYEVQQLCKKHNIQYFAEWGTLLGAIRHGGMIPWDDDFDICMLSEEYTRFLEVKDELPTEYEITEYQTNESDNMVVRVNNTSHIVVDGENLEKYHGFPYVAGIDIFRLDYLPRDEEEMQTHHEMILLVGAVIGLVMQIEESEEPEADLMEKTEAYLKRLEDMCHVTIDRDKRIKKQLYRLIQEEIGMMYTKAEADEVTNLPRWSNDYNYRLPKKCYENTITIPFENMEMVVPAGYDELLKRKYGLSNMEPIREGSAHAYPYYETFSEYLVENTSAEIYQYTYHYSEWEEVENERKQLSEKGQLPLYEQLQQFLPLFKEIHESILQFLKKKDWENAAGLIADSQDTAIEIGNRVEQEYSSADSLIQVLENYCEFLFLLYQQIQQTEKMEEKEIGKKFLQYENQLRVNIGQLPKKREIVFVPYKAEYWQTMECMWKKAMQEENTDVYVIPAPYYYKDAYGRPKKEEQQYDITGYPEEVILTSYEDYNFETHSPDEIVIQCPYDEYNYAMTIHPLFYAKNLKKYTKQLVYIPALLMKDIEPGDERARKMLKAYCNTPGVIHADKVIVQSENMKQVYVELLTAFAGKDTKTIWENKITNGNLSKQAKMEETVLEIPEEWKGVLEGKDGTRKHVVLYVTTASALYCYGDSMIKKMERVFNKFKNEKDSNAFIWRPDVKTRSVVRKSQPGIWRKYCDLLETYKKENWGILADDVGEEFLTDICDEVLGDADILLNMCRNKGKTVTVQTL